MTIKEACEVLQTTPPTVYRMIRDGRLEGIERPQFKHGRWRVTRESVERLKAGG